MPLKPSGNTPTSSPSPSSRSASGLHASVLPDLRAISPRNGVVKTRSAPSSRTCRCAGCRSCTVIAHMTESSAQRAPAWLATSRAPPSDGMLWIPIASMRNHWTSSGRNIGSTTLSVRSWSNPKSSTSYSPVSRLRRNASPPATDCSHADGSACADGADGADGAGGASSGVLSSGGSGLCCAAIAAARRAAVLRCRERAGEAGRVPAASSARNWMTCASSMFAHHRVLLRAVDSEQRAGEAFALPDALGRYHGLDRTPGEERVQRLLRRVLRRVPELGTQPFDVDDASEAEKVHLLR